MPLMTTMATAKLKKSIAEVGVPEVPEFLERSSPPAATYEPAACPPT
jgi:hypothetical protein